MTTASFATGPLTLTAHGWNSSAGTPYTADGDAGARDFIDRSNVPPGTVTLARQSPAAGLMSINGTATLDVERVIASSTSKALRQRRVLSTLHRRLR